MIKDFAAKGKSAGEISREIGVAENTARKYMREPAKPHGLKGRRKPSKLDPYKPSVLLFPKRWQSRKRNRKVLSVLLAALFSVEQ